MVFERKKIQTETLSEYLRDARQNLHLSIDEVSNKTGISQKFLTNLEIGNFKVLPADVYVLGFLKQLSQLYSADPQELTCQYKKEKGIERKIENQDKLESLSKWGGFFKKVVITPKLLTFILSLFFVVATLGYIIWQVWSINKTPTLEVISPQNNDIVSGAFVDVRGQTDPGILITINGQNIFVDSSGTFHNQVGLSQGPGQITISATNRFGKSVTKVVTLSGTAAAQDPGTLVLKIDFTDTVALGFAIDNQDRQTLSFGPGDSKTFTATQKIILDTTDAGATKLTLNGQVLGVMGKNKEQLNGVTFYPQHDTPKITPDPAVDKNTKITPTK